jgi:hypothetical protein
MCIPTPRSSAVDRHRVEEYACHRGHRADRATAGTEAVAS